MKIALSGDWHLGFSQFSAVENGRNVREMDVERAVAAAVDLIVAADPDLVLLGGDIFQHPRVNAHAIRAWRDAVRRISTETKAHLAVVQGNHDSARVASTLSPIVIPDDYDRVHIVLTPQRVRVPIIRTGEIASIACYPFVAREDTPAYKLEPDPEADVNCVLMHAAAQTSADGAETLPRFYAGDTAIDVGREAERFDLIACGDYHTFHRLHPTALALYPGAVERTTSDIWSEVSPKGIVLCDTNTGEMELREVPTREMVNVSLVLQEGMGADMVNEYLTKFAESAPIEDAMVRFKVEDFPKEERQHIDWALVRQIKQKCLHFYLDVRYAKREVVDLGDRRDRGALTLAEEGVAFFSEDPDDVRGLAFGYLDIEAESEEVAL